MPDVLSNDELNALAAEYVLGTLDYEERKGASALLEVDHAVPRQSSASGSGGSANCT